MTLEIVTYPDPRLQRQCQTVDVEHLDELQPVIDEMLDLMYAQGGIGLAAPQVGMNIRIFVMDPSLHADDPTVFINPRIVEKSGSLESGEGCLSFPGVQITVERANKIVVEAFDRYGTPTRTEADRLASRVIQHETDHLDGKLFYEYLSKMRQTMFLKKLKKLEKRGKRNPREPARPVIWKRQ